MMTIKKDPVAGIIPREQVQEAVILTKLQNDIAVLKTQNKILIESLDSLKRSHKDLKRKYASLSLYKLITKRHN